MIFNKPLDIANRALQIIGVPRISNFTATKAGLETGFAIDIIRQAELRRSVWTFATRRTALRPIVSTTTYLALTAYNSGTTYAAGDIVVDSNLYRWISTRNANLANTPGAGTLIPWWVPYFGPLTVQTWGATIGYFPGDLVVVSAVVYICVLAHTNHTPPNATYWHVVAGATAGALVQLSPLGVQAPTGTVTRNIYDLPSNYLRVAPQDPKVAGNARQGLAAGMRYNDWEFENGYLYTGDDSPIIFRFVADIVDFTIMEVLFCEVWASQLAADVAMPLTQSVEKMNNAVGRYERWVGIAKALNAIEEGSSEPELPEGGQAQAGGRQ